MDICQEETEFKWLDAAKKYEQELESNPQSGVLAGESWQKIGHCYDLAARQAMRAHFHEESSRINFITHSTKSLQ
jgi:hypothetical protein